jgi:nondiscriminating glutamyl-tRNA synthetase
MSHRIRARFAPSPTGSLHIGVAHTALFNWLFARQNGGTFILRIEDTDELRSTEESLQAILGGLKWLGLDWDEGPDVGGPVGPYLQSQRLDLYNDRLKRLLETGMAYRCYCTPEELEERRQDQRAAGLPPRYDGRCRDLTAEQQARLRAEGRAVSVRLRMPQEGQTAFRDLIRGELTFENALLDDIVLQKSSGWPTFHLANVVDDIEMRVTHVIRAEDHISNTPRHIQLYRALGAEPPVYAHLPLILGPDRSKLSKRHGAADLEDFRAAGILPEAMLNYLALLGWSCPQGEEILSREQLLERFSLERVGKAGAVFDRHKLEDVCSEHIRRADPERLADLAIPFLQQQGLVGPEVTPEYRAWLREVLALLQGRLRTLMQLKEHHSYFFVDEVAFDEKAVSKWLSVPSTADALQAIHSALSAAEPWTAERIEQAVRELADGLGVPAAKLIHPLRAAVTGTTIGPSLFDLVQLLGKARTLRRVERALWLTRQGRFAV